MMLGRAAVAILIFIVVFLAQLGSIFHSCKEGDPTGVCIAVVIAITLYITWSGLCLLESFGYV
jgi:hypothetical protein